MAATATAESLNVDRLQAVAGLFGQVFSGGASGKAPSAAMGATVNAQSIGARAGGVSEAERTMIAVVAGLNGKHAKAMDDQIQRAAELGAAAAREAGHKGTLTEEQAKAISDQVMKGLEGKHLSAQVKEKVGFFKAKAATVALAGAAVAVVTGTLALAAKPLAWATDKIAGTKISESFSVRGAVTKGFLAVAVAVGGVAAHNLYKRTARNNARDAAIVHAIQHGAQRHAQGGFVTRAAAAAAAAPQEPTLAADAPKQDQAQAQTQAAAKPVPNFGVNNTMNPSSVTYSFGPKPTTADAAKKQADIAAAAAKPIAPSLTSLIPAAATAIPAVKTAATVAAAAPVAAATAQKVAAAIKPDFGAKVSYGTVTYNGDAKLGAGGAIPGKTPEIKGVKVETKIG